MAHPFIFNQVQIIGDAYNESEIWTTSFSIGSPNGDATPPTLSRAQAIADAWEVFFLDGQARMGEYHRTTGLKYNAVGVDGLQITDPTIEYVYPTPITSGSTSADGPPQNTLVASLRADASRGLATKGRMYLPFGYATVGSDGKVASSIITAVGGAFVAFCEAVNAGEPADQQMILTSAAGAGGASHYVTNVQFGNVLDTQRRRRNALTEDYQTFSFIGGEPA